jgi:hypothetical protein
MILKYIRDIGEAIQEDTGKILQKLKIKAPSMNAKLVHYIKDNYTYVKNIEKYIAVKIAIKPFIGRIKEFIDKCNSSDLGKKIPDDLLNKKIKKKKRIEVFEKIYKDIDPKLLTDLEKTIKFEIRDFDLHNHDDLKLLIGNQLGTKIYHSPVMYQGVSQNQIQELPLWKINLSIDKSPYKELFGLFPSVIEYGRIAERSGEELARVFCSEMIQIIINDNLQKANLKSRKYYIAFLFTEEKLEDAPEYPYEEEELVNYFKSELKEEGVPGICQICGKEEMVREGPKGDLGFYTDDQKGFVPIHLDNSYTICQECNSYLIAGRNFIQSNLEFKLMNRGSRTKPLNPLLAYFIPYNEDSEKLEQILRIIETFQKEDREGLKGLAKKDIIDFEMEEIIEADMEDKEEENLQLKDGFELLNIPINISFSLLIVIFYHPEGQSSSFHNIKRIIHLNADEINKINSVYRTLRKEKNRSFSLRSLYYLFGQHKMEQYVYSILSLQKMNKRTLYRDVYQNLKQSFLEDALNPNKTASTRPTMHTFTSYLFMVKELDLL